MVVPLANAVSFAETMSTDIRFAHRNQCLKKAWRYIRPYKTYTGPLTIFVLT